MSKQPSFAINLPPFKEIYRDLFIVKDPTIISLALINLATIYIAYTEKWNVFGILWIYWAQSISIGIISSIKILTIRTKEKLSWSEIISSAFLLQFILSFTHFVYAVFIFILSIAYHADPMVIMLAFSSTSIGFFLNHLFSLLYHRRFDKDPNEDLATLRNAPMIRIFPMHITLMLGVGLLLLKKANIPLIGDIALTGNILILFMLLKTYVDLAAHVNEHKQPSPKNLP
ncbi:MAG: DUF6498-containing protein [Candidatus Margulisiibacteriota bacterium]